jgi:phosphoribosylanthranilate isomerase
MRSSHSSGAPERTQSSSWIDSSGGRTATEALPGIAIVQVIHVRGDESIDEALEAAPSVNAILLDSGNASLEVKELGGTGRRHDWAISRRIRERVAVPVYLAGGLRAENVAEAVHNVGPFGLDVCSGVRTGGKLDARKLEAFMRGARAQVSRATF